MLELTKYVLKKVSFDRQLFKKELIKSTRLLKRDELMLLYAWCLIHFTGEYQELVRQVFQRSFS